MMWPRVLELLLGCWLAASPIIFRYEATGYGNPLHDRACAVLIMLFALLSFWKRLRRMHLASIPVGFWLIALALFQERALPPYQNYVMVGVLLLVLAIVPSQASQPPQAWAAYLEREGH